MSLNTFDFAFLHLLVETKRILLLSLTRDEYRLIRLLVIYAALFDAHSNPFRSLVVSWHLIIVAYRMAQFGWFDGLWEIVPLGSTDSGGDSVLFLKNLRSLKNLNLRNM